MRTRQSSASSGSLKISIPAAGRDVIRLADGRLCRVIRVNYSAAVVIMNRPVRDFKTRFDKPVRFQPLPWRFYISPNSEVPILNRKQA